MDSVKPAVQEIRDSVRLALEEDRAAFDVTSIAVVPESTLCEAKIVSKDSGVLAGIDYALEAFLQCDKNITFNISANDGDKVSPGTDIMRVKGLARRVLSAERVALNFLQQLSGTATLTSQAVKMASGIKVLDTRKTVPGLRYAQKYAVSIGGGDNQRHNLEDEFLLKENHFTLSGLSYSETVKKAVALSQGKVVGVEAETFEQAREALKCDADYVLLDNFRDNNLVDAVSALRKEFPEAVLEASGGYTIEMLPSLASVGIDRISIGALTHSATALDISLLLTLIYD